MMHLLDLLIPIPLPPHKSVFAVFFLCFSYIWSADVDGWSDRLFVAFLFDPFTPSNSDFVLTFTPKFERQMNGKTFTKQNTRKTISLSTQFILAIRFISYWKSTLKIRLTDCDHFAFLFVFATNSLYTHSNVSHKVGNGSIALALKYQRRVTKLCIKFGRFIAYL